VITAATADYRFSEDLDFTLTEPLELDDILAGLTEMSTEPCAECFGRRI
jgi:hypothetical protein